MRMARKKTTRPAEAGPTADPKGTPVKTRTVQGKPVPAHLEHAIPHRLTDQGIDERNAKGKKTGHRVSVRDRFERDIEAREAAAKGLIEPWSAPDPLAEGVARDGDPRPEMQYRYLSDTVVKRLGRDGFEPCHDTDGNLIKVANMTLARMPKALAKRRNEHYREEGNAQLRESEALLQQNQEKLIADGKAVGLAPLRPHDVLRDSRDRTRTASVGLHLKRGNSRDVEE